MFDLQDFKFETLGYVKIPRVTISEKDIKQLGLPPDFSSEDYLKKLLNTKYTEKLKSGIIPKDKSDIYKERLKFELGEISKLQFIDYFCLIYDICRFARENGILSGAARGSSAGSCVLFVIDVTKVDPIKYNLLFERFISAARTEIKEINGEKYIASASLPDVDLDFQGSRKHEINDYLDKSFGGRTIAISNLSTFQSRALIKEVLKIYKNFSEEQVKAISDLIEVKFGVVSSIKESLENNPEFRSWAQDYPDIIRICCKLSNLIKNKSVHASAILVNENIAMDSLPCELSSSKELVCGYDKYTAEKLGIKVDNLGLKNLDIIDECYKTLGIEDKDIDIEDPEIYKFLNNSKDFYGIFQAEEGLGKQVLRKIKPNNINDIAVSIGLGRPGTLRFIDQYAESKNNNIKIDIDSRIIDILGPTQNILLWQEQIMKLSQRMANFTPKDADGLRKGIGRKIKAKILEYKDQFITGSLKNGYKEDLVLDIFQTMINSGDYSFNKCIFEEELVKTRYGGDIKLKDIRIGEEILAYNVKEDKDHWVKVKNIYKNKKYCFNLNVGGYSIKTSKEHRFLTEDKKMTALYYLYADLQETALENYCTNLGRNNKIFTINGPKNLGSIFPPNLIDGILNTIDLEVDHEDHNFYCNNIVVSNSHAIGYSFTTAKTAYLKAKYPVNFFCACFNTAKNEAKPLEEIAKIKSELVNFGIKLLPPNLLKSKDKFIVDGDKIVFPLSNMKGVANTTLQKLYKLQGSYKNKLELFKACDQAGVSSAVLAGLIMAGALEGIVEKQKRSHLMAEAALWHILAGKDDREKNKALEICENYNCDLFAIVKSFSTIVEENGKPFLRGKRMETIKKHFEPHKQIYEQNRKNEDLTIFYFETMLLGFAYTNNLYDIYRTKCSDLITIGECNNSLMDDRVKVIGVAEEVSRGTSQKGTDYLRFKCVGHDGKITCLLFNGKKVKKILEHEEINGRIVKDGDIVICSGSKKEDAIFCDNVGIQEVKIYNKIKDLEEDKEKI